MPSRRLVRWSAALLLTAAGTMSHAATSSTDLATLQNLPLFSLGGLQYIGGFRFPTATYGASSVDYSEGPITLGASGDSMFVVGHAQVQAIGQFKIPALVNSQNLSDFNTATVMQNFAKVLDRPQSGNPQGLNTIGGMEYVNGHLLVNAYVYYDASDSATQTTLVVKDASNLAGSAVAGYDSFPGAAHASGWISPIPLNWQSALGGTYITGNSSGKPIISRLSVGPTAFAFDPTSPDISTLAPSTLPVTTLMDFSLDHMMGAGTQSYETYLNAAGNAMWNNLSHVAYAFIVPGTRTYMAIGNNGGIASGIGYKITQDTGYHCGGYCSYQASDNYNYYWLFDLDDLLKVKAGQMSPYDVKPYAYGKFNLKFPNNGSDNAIIGGTFDSSKNILYLSIQNGDPLGVSGWAPLIVAFKVTGVPAAPVAPANLTVQPVQ